MKTKPSFICPICGNFMEDSRCNRCDANEFTRQRRWRRGDKKGKRPERRQDRRLFQETLDGLWKNSRYLVAIQINADHGTYHSQHSLQPETHHHFQMIEDRQELHTFYKDDLLIEAAINDMGFLVLVSNDKKMAFAYEYDELLYLTCPLCYAKSPIDYESCRECWWEFKPFDTK